MRQFLGALLAAVAVVACGAGAAPLSAQSPAALDRHFAPSPVPDRVVLTFTADPATTFAVTWRTDESVARPLVEIVQATGSPDLQAGARTLPARTASLSAENGTAHHHAAVVDGLLPSTTYAYRVGGGEVWSEWYHYRTASTEAEPFSFIYFGDAQNEIRSLWSRALRDAFREAPAARFLVHAGDLVNLREGNHDTEWGEWFGAGEWLNAMIPSIPAVGNHEYVKADTADVYERLSPHWSRQFTLPSDGPGGLEGTVYHVDYQGVRVIVLNSLHALDRGSAAEQAKWLETRLAGNPNRWTVVAYHHPMYSTRADRDNPELREHWQPLFERYGVDLVLQGHDHAYGRGVNVAEGSRAQDGAAGPVYVVSVSGPKMYEVNPEARWAKVRGEDTQLFQVIDVTRDRLRFTARTVGGDTFDAFDLVKGSDGRSRLVEASP